MPAAPTIPVQHAVREAAGRLRAAGRDDAQDLAEWLAAELAGIGRAAVPLSGDTGIDADRFSGLLDRLAAGEPLQYVLGVTPFMNVDLLTDARALIPRPETEQLVDLALAPGQGRGGPGSPKGQDRQAKGIRVADVGTGSGCIAIQWAHARPQDAITAIDSSSEALSLARENARRNPCRITFLKADLLGGQPPGAFDLVIANLPYVAAGEMAGLPREVRDYEPRQALDGGASGTEVIERLIGQSATVLSAGGALWLEIGETQGEYFGGLMERAGFDPVRVIQDFAGKPRFIHGTTTGS